MGDFSSGFSTGFQIGAIIKEKKIAKKATEDLQAALQEWQMSGKEPSYVDKLMLGLTATKVGENYSRIFGDIINNQASYDKEKMSQNAINLREYNAQVLNFVKMIQTSAKEGTLDLIPWDSVQALMPDVDLTEVLSSIPELKNKQYEAKTKEQNIDIYGKTPESIRQAVGEQAGLIPTGLQPTPKEPTPLSAKDNWAIENYNAGKISFDQLSKYMGTLIEPEKATAIEQKITEAKKYGATNEEIKGMLIGTGGGGDESIIQRTDIAYWEKTFDSVTNEDEYNRQYSLLKKSDVSKEYEPKPYKEMLQSEVKAMAQELKGFLTSDNKFRDEEAKATYAKYQRIYDQKVKELLAKYPDIDKSQFPKFLSIDEIKPVGFWKGAFTGGVAKGDYSVIDPKGW